jgi:hypothetical protein
MSSLADTCKNRASPGKFCTCSCRCVCLYPSGRVLWVPHDDSIVKQPALPAAEEAGKLAAA